MKYLSVVEFAKKLELSERTVRNYCALGKLKGAFLTGKTWSIPEDAVIAQKGNEKVNKNILLNNLKEQKNMKLKGGIYHRTQIDLTYNSNKIEGRKQTNARSNEIYF
jgi:hypothetical protein